MRTHFIQAIQALCQKRNISNSDIRWWFSEHRPQPESSDVKIFPNEHTVPITMDTDATLEDVLLPEEFSYYLTSENVSF